MVNLRSTGHLFWNRKKKKNFMSLEIISQLKPEKQLKNMNGLFIIIIIIIIMRNIFVLNIKLAALISINLR